MDLRRDDLQGISVNFRERAESASRDSHFEDHGELEIVMRELPSSDCAPFFIQERS